MKKTFDCVEMKRQIQEQLWKEAGETLDGFKKILFDKSNNELYNKLMKKRDQKFVQLFQ